MKRILILLAMLPAMAFAQKLQLGLNAGAQYNLPTKFVTTHGRINGYASVRALKDIGRHLQLGLTVDIGKITLGTDQETYTDESFTKKNKAIYIVAGPYVSPNIILNYKKPLGKGYLYGGISAGYCRCFKDGSADAKLVERQTPYFSVYELVGTKIPLGPHDWMLFGAQAGYTMQLTKKLGLNAEAAIRMARNARSDFFMEPGDKFIPVSVGVRYAL